MTALVRPSGAERRIENRGESDLQIVAVPADIHQITDDQLGVMARAGRPLSAHSTASSAATPKPAKPATSGITVPS